MQEQHYRDQYEGSALLRLMKRVGKKLFEPAQLLYYILKSPDTPKWAYMVALGALGYFVMPLDGIPDPLPLVGFADDLAVLLGALNKLNSYITPEMREKAREFWEGRGGA